MNRKGRNYRLTIGIRNGEVVVEPPLRVSFDAMKSIRGGLNKMTLQVWNLQEKNRLAIVKDAEQQTRIPFSLSVGYQDRLELIFKGTVHTGENQRQGPDLVTTLESLDGGFDFLNSFTSTTIRSGQRAVDAALQDMPNTQRGKITQRETLTRPKVLVGNSAQIIDDAIGPGETWYIEDEQLYVIRDNETISSFIPVVSAETGLISTPERKSREVTFQTLINPSVKIGRRVQLISATAPHLDGVYRIETINYKGDNYGDEWTQVCTGRLLAEAVVL